MPISQLTVLALYGELRNLVTRIEMSAEILYQMSRHEPDETKRARIYTQVAGLRSDCLLAERAAIGVILADAPQIKIDPLTGEAS